MGGRDLTGWRHRSDEKIKSRTGLTRRPSFPFSTSSIHTARPSNLDILDGLQDLAKAQPERLRGGAPILATSVPPADPRASDLASYRQYRIESHLLLTRSPCLALLRRTARHPPPFLALVTASTASLLCLPRSKLTPKS